MLYRHSGWFCGTLLLARIKFSYIQILRSLIIADHFNNFDSFYSDLGTNARQLISLHCSSIGSYVIRGSDARPINVVRLLNMVSQRWSMWSDDRY